MRAPLSFWLKYPRRRLFPVLLIAAHPALAAPSDALCDGKYAQTQAMLDSTYGRYGTLYSGDVISGLGADLGPTLDLYRLWHGLPDANFRGGKDLSKPTWFKTEPPGGPWSFDANYVSPEWADFALTTALPFATAETEAQSGPREWVAGTLDILTVPGPTPDWWFNPARAGALTNTQAVIAHRARQTDLIDWLLGTTVQSAHPIFAWPEPSEYRNSHPPGGLAPGTFPRFDSLAARYLQKYDQTQALEWATLALLFPTPLDHRDTAEALSSDWLTHTKACTASPAEYAAFAVTWFDQSGRDIWAGTLPDPTGPFALLPPRMQRQMLDREARSLLARQIQSDPYEWRKARDYSTELPRLTLLSNRLRATEEYFFTGQGTLQIQSYFATDIDSFAETLHSSHIYWADTQINLLSTTNLRHLAADPAIPIPIRVNIARVAFLRLLALGDYDQADAALQAYLSLFPADQPAATRAAAHAPDLPTRLALTALALPELSTRYTPPGVYAEARPTNFRAYLSFNHGPDLPDWLRTGGRLQRDVEWALRVGSFWFAQKGYGGAAFRRLSQRGQTPTPPEPHFVAFPPQGPNTPGIPFARLVALNETTQLGPETGLTQRLSDIILTWAEASTTTLPALLNAQSGPIPAALAQIVHLNRYRTTGTHNGTFPGRAAFRLLHTRFPLTPSAQQTPHWYRCDDWKCDRWTPILRPQFTSVQILPPEAPLPKPYHPVNF